MTTLSFNAGYAMFQSDSALFSRPAGMTALHRQLGRAVSSRQVQATTDFAGRVLLALVPFSALAWMFVAR